MLVCAANAVKAGKIGRCESSSVGGGGGVFAKVEVLKDDKKGESLVGGASFSGVFASEVFLRGDGACGESFPGGEPDHSLWGRGARGARSFCGGFEGAGGEVGGRR